MGRKEGDDEYVIVTMAPGVDAPVHVYGDENGKPFKSHSVAAANVVRMIATDKARHPGLPPVLYLIRQVLGGKPG